MPSRKLLLIGTQMATAGAQRVLLSQAQWFHQKEYQVTVVFFYDKQELEQRWREQSPFKIINLRAWKADGKALPNFIRLAIGLSRLFLIMIANRFDIVETFTLQSNVLGIPLAWMMAIDFRIATHHGKVEDAPNWLLSVHRLIINSRMAHILVAVSSNVKKYAVESEGMQAERIKIILNGIDVRGQGATTAREIEKIREELNLGPDTNLILSVGRLVTQKGHSYLLDSIPQVLEKFPNTVFAIAGEGYLERPLITKAAQMGIIDNLIFLGIRTDSPALLNTADLFALPSLWEGLSISMLEAMNSETPVVATAVEGALDVITSGESGIIVPIKDSGAFANAIIDLLANPKERERIGKNGKKLVAESYTLDRMCNQYEELFLDSSK